MEIISRFPELWQYYEACLAASATWYIEDIKDPATLFLIGQPSTGKTTVLNAFDDYPRTLWADDFTPASFMSHYPQLSEKELQQIDLIRKMNNRIFIVPDLAPIFSARQEALVKNIGLLTRILDGEGLTTHSGVHGERKYKEETRFTFLAATTPPPDKLWKTLGILGNRILFLRLHHSKEESFSDRFLRSLSEESYKSKREATRGHTHDFLVGLDQRGIVSWDQTKDDVDTIKKLSEYAEFSARLRGRIDTEAIGNHRFKSQPQIEDPIRFASLLYNLARGRAHIYEREGVDNSDLELIKRVSLSSCRNHRYEMISLLGKMGGIATATKVMESLDIARSTAHKRMNEFVSLGICDMSTRVLPGGGNETILSIKDSYKHLL